MKLFQNFQNRTRGFREEDFLRISSCPYSAKKKSLPPPPPPPPPPNSGHVFPWVKISRTIFEKGHPRNNPVKLFQNLTSGFRGEEF